MSVSEERKRRLGRAWAAAIASKAGARWWWLSFANDAGWLGAAMVRAPTFGDAGRAAWYLRINPGGNVKGVPIPDEFVGLCSPDDVYRLLTREDMSRLDAVHIETEGESVTVGDGDPPDGWS